MNSNYDLLDWLGEQAAMEIGNLVQYARKGRKPYLYFNGYKYELNDGNEYVCWRNLHGVNVCFRFQDAVDKVLNEDKPTPAAFAAMFGAPPENEEKRRELYGSMEAEMKRVGPLLKREGRRIIPDNGVTNESVYDQSSLKPFVKEYANKTVALYKTIPYTNIKVLVQRRIYDGLGYVLQDFDYCHGKGAHIFPHIHVWTYPESGNRKKRKRSAPLKYQTMGKRK